MATDPDREGSTNANVPTVRINCGCCGVAFEVPCGGSAYCGVCLAGKQPIEIARKLMYG